MISSYFAVVLTTLATTFATQAATAIYQRLTRKRPALSEISIETNLDVPVGNIRKLTKDLESGKINPSAAVGPIKVIQRDISEGIESGKYVFASNAKPVEPCVSVRYNMMYRRFESSDGRFYCLASPQGDVPIKFDHSTNEFVTALGGRYSAGLTSDFSVVKHCACRDGLKYNPMNVRYEHEDGTDAGSYDPKLNRFVKLVPMLSGGPDLGSKARPKLADEAQQLARADAPLGQRVAKYKGEISQPGKLFDYPPRSLDIELRRPKPTGPDSTI